MLGRRHSNSVAEEGGRSTGRTRTEDGQRRQVEPLACLHRIYSCSPERSAVVSYRPEHLRNLIGAQRRRWLLYGKTLLLPRPELIGSFYP